MCKSLVFPWALHLGNKSSREGPAYCYDITITPASQLWRASQFAEYFYFFIKLSPHPWEVGIIVSLYSREKLQGWDVQHCPRPQWWTCGPNLTLCLPNSPSFGHSSGYAEVWARPQSPPGFTFLNCTMMTWIWPSLRSLLALLYFEFEFIQ